MIAVRVQGEDYASYTFGELCELEQSDARREQDVIGLFEESELPKKVLESPNT